ncbi:MAG: hypothetical protein J6J24_03730 [Clostridia bacterium]|nr:hypothetical protein [Clostridia bacterium]
MEEKEEVLEEQPQVETVSTDNNDGSSSGDDVASEQEQTGEAERGVPIGKFKNVEDLVDAYNHLQAEFTRKCQRLSELEKKDKMLENDTQNNFEENFKTFLLNNQEAYSYAEEIKSRVENDESLKNQENAFEKVWAEIVYKKISDPQRDKDSFVQNLVLKDKNLENLIIENYMKQLQKQTTPYVMTSNSGERVTKTVTPRPDSFEEAKKLAIDLLN